MLKDKVIIVTGAGSGIGLATAQLLAQAGAKVVVRAVTERNESVLGFSRRLVCDSGVSPGGRGEHGCVT